MKPAMEGVMAAVEGMLHDVRQKWKDSQQQAGMLESFRAFAAAVDWTVCQSLISCNTGPLQQTGPSLYCLLSWQKPAAFRHCTCSTLCRLHKCLTW